MAPEPPVAPPAVVDVAPTTTAVVRGVVAMDELPAFFDSSFGQLGGLLAEQGVTIAGPAFALYHGAPEATADLEVGFPTVGEVRPDQGVEVGTLPGGRAARVVHAGGFDQLGEAWGALAAWIGTQGLTPSSLMWEVYVTEPSPDMDPADLRTELSWLLET